MVDNGEATLEVGDQVPVTTGSATVLSANNAVVNTVDYKNTGIILHVQPRVNSNGSVLLDIDQEISNVQRHGTQHDSRNLTPTISERKVSSEISVVSGQTVLLAGLIQDQQEKSRAGHTDAQPASLCRRGVRHDRKARTCAPNSSSSSGRRSFATASTRRWSPKSFARRCAAARTQALTLPGHAQRQRPAGAVTTNEPSGR